MSKSEGLKIGIKFTEELLGDVINQSSIFEAQDGDWSVNGTYNGSVGDIKDGSTSSYWQSRSASNYIQITRKNTKLLGIKIYKGSSYRPSTYTLKTSTDGVTYTDAHVGSFQASTGWQEILFENPVIADNFRITFGYTTRLYIYELLLIVEGYNNVLINDFIVNGAEAKHVNGELVTKRYKVSAIEKHPTEPKSIVLETYWEDRFNNVEGELTVEYDSTKGVLAGIGGPVESFTKSFLPQDLIKLPNPYAPERFTVAPNANIQFARVTYNSRYASEKFSVTAACTINFEFVGIINP